MSDNYIFRTAYLKVSLDERHTEKPLEQRRTLADTATVTPSG